ncbi:hypothetical protein [Algoriphagus resistens]|uniref:hypothetical protein n=1 Tax=Algoriphagus resistens TaxID=1750590 RepID=UPI0007168712|nr:hypothetical protein [Algoriphagus resistens]
MHIGTFLKNEAEKQRLSTADIGEMINKTAQAVRGDFKKSELQMAVLESYAKALNINIYQILAAEWEGTPYSDEGTHTMISKNDRPQLNAPPTDRKLKNMETVSVTFQIPAAKKEALLKLLTA